MSCTVLALPITLAGVIMGVVSQGAIVGVQAAVNKKYSDTKETVDYKQNLEKHIKELQQELLLEHSEDENLSEITYQTVYTDAGLLIKTLNEHGVENLTNNNDVIACEVENYKLTFSKNETSEAYSMKIVCPENAMAEEKINDLNNEYTANVQEESYLHIINKLEENNMKLESEEVLEDNTIVLTINLE